MCLRSLWEVRRLALSVRDGCGVQGVEGGWQGSSLEAGRSSTRKVVGSGSPRKKAGGHRGGRGPWWWCGGRLLCCAVLCCAVLCCRAVRPTGAARGGRGWEAGRQASTGNTERWGTGSRSRPSGLRNSTAPETSVTCHRDSHSGLRRRPGVEIQRGNWSNATQDL